jgi:hypothetical protein
MKMLEIIGAILYFVGFCFVFPWENLEEFIAWITKKGDVFYKKTNPEKHAAWTEKIRPSIGWLLILIGSFISLFDTIWKTGIFQLIFSKS